jgi:RNA polymerase sigma-70 factor (ECF subfamily)
MTDSDRAQHDHFLRLFMEHEESLRVFVRSLLFSHDEEREVMQEVAVVLWRKFDAGMDSQAFCRWAFGVARMEALAFRRDRARDRHSFGDEVFELLGQTVLEHSDALEAERRALSTCLQKLPDDQRRLVQAAYAPGVKIDDLAAQLGRTAMALYKTLHRIRLTLMDCTRRVLASEELT